MKKNYISLAIQVIGMMQLFYSLINLIHDNYYFAIILYMFGVFCLIFPLQKEKKTSYGIALLSFPFSVFITGKLLDFIANMSVRLSFIIELFLFAMIPLLISGSFIVLIKKT